MQRLRFKKSIADAAVDGVVPEDHLRSPEGAYQDLMAWLERLSAGQLVSVQRPDVVFAFPEESQDSERRRAMFGDFSRMNAKWNQERSSTRHERIAQDPAEWRHYHEELDRVRKTWAIDPQEEFIRWAGLRSDLAIGDFGCGRAKVWAALRDRHVVHSFDHLAANENVIACDMAKTPLDDETLGVALFCLSLMGANATDYIREAGRTLKLDGWLHIYEASSRFSDVEGFIRGLRDLGFGHIERRDLGKFTHISGRKTENRPREGIELRF
jgi:hypothetical protein